MSHGSHPLHPAFITTENEEDRRDYVKGGYHAVKMGDSFSNDRYIIVRKLSWKQHFTMWLAKDQKMQRHVALKITKSGPRWTKCAVDEIKLYQRVISPSTSPTTSIANPNPPLSPSHTHPGRSHIISLLDHFRHKGPNGIHVCMVFEVLGEDLLGLMQRHGNEGVPMPMVRQIAKQVLLGLDYMHRCCGIIHTEIKPENILVCIDNVEATIQSELATSNANSASPSTNVPPYNGRGGNQMSHSESVSITGSQPLSPSPPSFGSIPMLDRSAFRQGKVDGEDESKPASFADQELEKAKRADSTDLVTRMSNAMLLDPSECGEKVTKTLLAAPGSSLLSQQASSPIIAPSTGPLPVHPAGSEPGPDAHVSNSFLSVDQQSTMETSTSSPPNRNERLTVKIVDLERAQWVGHGFTHLIQKQQYRCPEVILGAEWSTSADIWSVACVIFELITDEYLFHPASGSLFSVDDDHIAQIMELMGDIPQSIKSSGKHSSEFFNGEGELRHINELRYWPLDAVLRDRYLFSKADADTLASFLTRMLCLHPDKRAKASELIHHNWLDGVHVQGEVDTTSRADAGKTRLSGLNESEIDAMKPVDDIVVSRHRERSREPSLLSLHRAQRTLVPVPSPPRTKNVPGPSRSPVTSKHSRKHSRSVSPHSDDSSNSAESRHSSASSISSLLSLVRPSPMVRTP